MENDRNEPYPETVTVFLAGDFTWSRLVMDQQRSLADGRRLLTRSRPGRLIVTRDDGTMVNYRHTPKSQDMRGYAGPAEVWQMPSYGVVRSVWMSHLAIVNALSPKEYNVRGWKLHHV